jgi:hypothetical protein
VGGALRKMRKLRPDREADIVLSRSEFLNDPNP